MLFHVHMNVAIPHEIDSDVSTELAARERKRVHELQHSGHWPHLWRVVGCPASISTFDVDSTEELHELLASLPLFPYITMAVTPLATHPSAQAAPTG